MDAKKYALPNCPRCHGSGYIHGKTVMEHRLCMCAILGQHREAAEMRISATLPKAAAKMTFASYNTGGNQVNERALTAARNFVEHWEDRATEKGWILGFYGEPASGKTHLAHAIAIALIKRYFVTAEVLNVPNMLRLEKERFNEDSKNRTQSLIQRAIDCDFLVLDDLGSEYRKSQDGTVTWLDEQLYNILDARIMNLRPMVYTTNLAPDALKTLLSSAQDEMLNRIWSRIERAQVGPALPVRPVAGSNRQDPDDRALLFG